MNKLTSLKNFILQIAAVSCLFISCNSSIKIADTYFGNQTNTTFILNNDSTFSYRYKFEIAYEYSTGTWKYKKKGKVFLNSAIENRNLALTGHERQVNISKNSNECFLSVNINITDAEKKYYECLIFINDSFYTKKSCDSILLLPLPMPVHSIFLRLSADERIPTRFLDTLTTNKYFTVNKNFNDLKLDISYNDSLFNYRVFKNEILKFTKQGLYFFNPRNGQKEFLPRK